MKQIYKGTVAGLSVVLASSLPVASWAAGYALNEKSASSAAMANAGAAANAENATVMFFNPAGIGRLEGTNISGGIAALDIKSDTESSATDAVGQPMTGTPGEDFVPTPVIPNLAASHALNDNVTLGLGLSAPFGLDADYDDTFVGRNFADITEIKIIDLQPTIALHNDEGFAIGVGINLMHAEGRLTKFQDYTDQQQQLGTGLVPESKGYFDVEGDDYGVGLTFGLMFKPAEHTDIGIAFRSSTQFELEGDATLSNAPNFASPGTAVKLKESAKLDLETPESLEFSLKQGLTPKWDLLLGAKWTKWSRFEDITIKSDQDNAGSIGTISQLGSQKYGGDGVIGYVPEHWKDVWAFSVGTRYQLTDAWALKAGYARDNSPIRDQYRTARVPSDDRNWFTLGVQWENRGWAVDTALGYSQVGEVDVDEREYNVNDEPLANQSRFQGTYDLSAWGAAVQVSKAF
ncbi:TonB-dependent receptor [Marinobacteraceae bacterium S3BR75-40.1]